MQGGIFLNEGELQQLTARKFKSKQIEWLRSAGLPFRITATGHPVVTRAAVEVGSTEQPAQQGWQPRVMKAR